MNVIIVIIKTKIRKESPKLIMQRYLSCRRVTGIIDGALTFACVIVNITKQQTFNIENKTTTNDKNSYKQVSEIM